MVRFRLFYSQCSGLTFFYIAVEGNARKHCGLPNKLYAYIVQLHIIELEFNNYFIEINKINV